MAVQAQSPANPHFPDFRFRPEQQLYARENNIVMPLVSVSTSNFEDSPLQSSAPVANVGNLQQHGNESFFCDANNDVECASIIGSRKRPRVYGGVSPMHRQRTVADPNPNHATCSGVFQQYTGTSTGLNLTFRDGKFEPSTPASSRRMRRGVAILSTLIEDLVPQLSQQREEIDELIKNQEEQLKRNLDEKRHQHSRAMVAIIENWLARTLREKEVELEKVKSKNADLEDKIKSLFQQACAWQNRAKFNETMIFALKNNLQQAVAMSREQSKEECGDSHQADDAESTHLDDTADAKAMAFKENKQLKEQRSCKVCRSNDVSVLLLPCRHLCLCKECDVTLDSCPLCRCFKSASVQVYLT